MDVQAVFSDVVATPSDQMGELPDEAIVIAAGYAAEMGFSLEALMLGIEIGLRGSSEPQIITALVKLVEG